MPPIAAPEGTVPTAPPRALRLSLDDITVTVPEPGRAAVQILDIPDLQIPPGQSIGIAGPSGAGKTTLLHLIAGLLLPSTGSVRWGADAVNHRSEGERDRWRRRTIGLVFQDFALVPELNVLENILLPARFETWRVPPAVRGEATALTKRLDIAKLSARVASLSRGEQQRVAVARALFGNPALLLADEPTASLDIENSTKVAAMLLEGARANGATLIAVTHDAALLSRLNRVIRIERGRIVENTAP